MLRRPKKGETTSRVAHTTVDCANAYDLSEWWKGVLDYVDVGGRDDEVARLVEHGAVQIADHRGKYGPGTGWGVLAELTSGAPADRPASTEA